MPLPSRRNIIRLAPPLVINEEQLHHASGINQNFQWCGIGFSQLPNGLGWACSDGEERIARWLAAAPV